MPELIGRETFKALSAPSRIDIVKKLGKRRATATELAESLKLSVPTVTEHLRVLEQAGIVAAEHSERKWRYWELTQRGRAMLAPSSDNSFWVMLVAMFVGITLFTWGLYSMPAPGGAPMKEVSETALSAAGAFAVPAAPPTPIPVTAVSGGIAGRDVAMFVGAVVALASGWALFKWRRTRRRR